MEQQSMNHFTIKRLAMAMALAGSLMTIGSASWAAVTPMTDAIHGVKPALKLAAKGTLEAGQVISVDKSDPVLWQFLDRDGDIDNSLATLQWYRVPAKATDLSGATKLGAEGDSSITLTVADVGHQIGFTVIPLTVTGLPDRNNMITVLNAAKWGGIDENGTTPEEETNTNVTDPGGEGVVTDPGTLNAVIYIDQAGTQELTGNPQVDTSYYVRIYADAARTQDVTTEYQSTIQWYLNDPETDTNTPVNAANAEKTEFRTQATNADAQAQHSQHTSEQGMRIYVEFGN